MELVVLQNNGTYITIGTEGISTPKYAKYGIWENMVKRGIFFLTRLPGPSEIIQNNRLKVMMTYLYPPLSFGFFSCLHSIFLSFHLFIFSSFGLLSVCLLSSCLSVFLSFRLSAFSVLLPFLLSVFSLCIFVSFFLCLCSS